MDTPNTYNKITFRNVPLRSEDYEKLCRAKILYERDFHKRVSWSDFLISLAVGFCLGRSLLVNENKFNLLLEEEEPHPQLQSHLRPHRRLNHLQDKKQP